MQNNPLLITPVPFHDESLYGYILRLTEQNLYESFIWIESLIYDQKQKENKHFQKEMILNLSAVTNWSEEILLSLIHNYGCIKDDRILYSNHIILRKSRICPNCLIEKPYIRKYWEILFITTCPIHKCLLVDICPKCGKPIKIKRTKITLCSCGFDFRMTKIQSRDNIDTSLSNYLFRRISGKNKTLDIPLNELDIEEVLNLIRFFAKRIKGSFLSENPSLKSMSIFELNSIGFESFKIFTDWPVGFHQFLDRLIRERVKTNALVKDLGSFKRSLRKQKFLEEAFSEFAWNNIDNFISQSLMGCIQQERVKNGQLSGTEASKFIGLNLKSLERLLEDKIIEGSIYKATNKKKLFLISQESAHKLKEKMSNWYTTKETRDLLNIGEKSLNQLNKMKILETLEIPRNGSIKRYFNPVSVSRFIDKLESKVQITKPKMDNILITFPEAIRFFNSYVPGTNAGTLFNDVIEGKIQSVYKSGKGLKGLVFSKEEMRLLAEEKAKEIKGDSYLLKEAASYLKIKIENLRHFIKIGLLNRGGKQNNKFYAISLDEIKKFQENYIDLPTLKNEYTFDFYPSINNLMKNGLIPIAGPEVNNGTKYLFAVKDVESFLFKENKKVALQFSANRDLIVGNLSRNLILNSTKLEVKVNQQTYFLSNNEFNALEHLVNNMESVVPYEDLMENVWPEKRGLSEKFKVNSKDLYELIYRIRKKIRPEIKINNCRGKGYILSMSEIKN